MTFFNCTKHLLGNGLGPPHEIQWNGRSRQGESTWPRNPSKLCMMGRRQGVPDMKTASVSALRARLSHYLKLTEPVLVTQQGRPKAVCGLSKVRTTWNVVQFLDIGTRVDKNMQR